MVMYTEKIDDLETSKQMVSNLELNILRSTNLQKS